MGAKHVLADVCEVKKRSDVFHVDPEIIIVVDGWNARTDFSGERELIDSIIARGVIKPLLVRKTKEKILELVDGERRLRAALRARQEGAEIKSVPIMVAPRGMNDADLYFDALLSNGGKPFTPLEEAAAFQRLVNWGFKVADIAMRTGKSISSVRNRLELESASPEVKEAAAKGEITLQDAQQIAKGSKSIEGQGAELKKRKSRPKKPRLCFSFTKGKLKQTGLKDRGCDPIEEILKDGGFIEALEREGFDPDSLRISIVAIKEAEEQEQTSLFKGE